jgi:hypothetical protein
VESVCRDFITRSWHATTLVIEPFRCQFTVATSYKRRNLFGHYAEREPIWPPSLFKMDHFQTTGRCPLWVKSRHVQRTSRCPLCARSGHASFRWSYLLSAIGGHSANPSRASGTLSRSHEVEVAIDQNFTRHLLGTLRALYLVSKIVVWGSGNSKAAPRGNNLRAWP